MSESNVESMLRNRLELAQVRHTSFVEIRAYSESPEEAAELANKVADAYREVCMEQAPKYANTPTARIVTILDRAVPDRIPVRPNKPANTVLGAMMGVMLGLIVGTIATGFIEAAKKHRNALMALNA